MRKNHGLIKMKVVNDIGIREKTHVEQLVNTIVIICPHNECMVRNKRADV
jgi:hypothetical protein